MQQSPLVILEQYSVLFCTLENIPTIPPLVIFHHSQAMLTHNKLTIYIEKINYFHLQLYWRPRPLRLRVSRVQYYYRLFSISCFSKKLLVLALRVVVFTKIQPCPFHLYLSIDTVLPLRYLTKAHSSEASFESVIPLCRSAYRTFCSRFKATMVT